ncbi:6416_t:CDS:2, partial [Paraglomus occultum]
TNEEAEIRPTISLHQAVTALKTLTQFLQYSTGPEILPEDIAVLYRFFCWATRKSSIHEGYRSKAKGLSESKKELQNYYEIIELIIKGFLTKGGTGSVVSVLAVPLD